MGRARGGALNAFPYSWISWPELLLCCSLFCFIWNGATDSLLSRPLILWMQISNSPFLFLSSCKKTYPMVCVCRMEDTRCLMTFSNPVHTKIRKLAFISSCSLASIFYFEFLTQLLGNSGFSSQLLGLQDPSFHFCSVTLSHFSEPIFHVSPTRTLWCLPHCMTMIV